MSATETDVLSLFFPYKGHPTVSVTGDRCDLRCPHCMGHYLRGMVPLTTSDSVVSYVDSASDEVESITFSGGCDMRGSVPLLLVEKGLKYAADNGMRVCAHTGFQKDEEIRRLIDAGVTDFLIDLHQDPEIIRNVLGIPREPGEYSDLIDSILEHGGKVTVHLCFGFGKVDYELSKELMKRKGIREITVLTLVPTEGTCIEDSVIAEDTVVDCIRDLIDSGFEVTLGCMRDRSLRGLEKKSIDLGVRKIANPSTDTELYASEKGLSIVKKNTCCCL